ncbi:hypothetical protein BY458DRAFT_425944, partial [Sporodiniella umbellata]
DDKSQYKVDEIIEPLKMKEIEILLIETSGSLGHKNKSKIDFDHYKGAFGSLITLKLIVDKFNYGSPDEFKTMIFFFLH